jgi:hypothetical protein
MYNQLPYVYPRSRSPIRNATGLTAGQWQGAISQCSTQTGLNAAQCAQTLSRSRSPTRVPIYPQINGSSPRTSPQVVISRNDAVGLTSASKSGNQSPTRNMQSYQQSYANLPATRTRSRSPTQTGEVVISRDTAVGLTSASKVGQSPRNTSSLNVEDLRRVAQALGITTTGDAQYLADAIRNRVGAMSPRTYGNLSPRTLNTYRGF